MKNIKMEPPVPPLNLLKKSSMILYLFLKAKSQAKTYIIKTVVCCLRKRKDVLLFYVLFEFQIGLT